MDNILVLSGPLTFSDVAANKYLNISGLGRNKVYMKSNWDIAKNISNGFNELGIVASYNSVTGLVDESRKGFMDLDIFKTGEVKTNIDQYLCYNCDSIEDLKFLYSHPQAINQCSNLVEGLNVEIVYADSTSEGVELAMGRLGSGAIGTLAAIKNSGLNYMLEPVQNDDTNYTIFSVIVPGLSAPEIEIIDQNRLLVLVDLLDKPNDLLSFLEICRDRNLGELYIQTNQNPRALVEIPFEGGDDYSSLVGEIEKWSQEYNGRNFKVKGVYKKAD